MPAATPTMPGRLPDATSSAVRQRPGWGATPQQLPFDSTSVLVGAHAAIAPAATSLDLAATSLDLAATSLDLAATSQGELTGLWQRALGSLKRLAGRSAVDTWLLKVELMGLRPVTDADRGSTGELPNADGPLWVHADLRAVDEQVALFVRDHHLGAIETALGQVVGQAMGTVARVRAAIDTGSAAPAIGLDASSVLDPSAPGAGVEGASWHASAAVGSGAGAASHERDAWADLVERFTFERFVVGKANELAASVASAICQAPGQLYNPLFVHGGVGLGKTHLLHAIGHRLRTLRPNLRVRYVAAETYIDDVYAAWRSKDGASRQDVRAHYRDGADVLLLDDAQFLQGNDKIGEEFFHLFNALHHSGKQIVLTADRYPSELQGLHERLRSRLQWGLVAELSPPDRELRVALLRHKAAELQLALPPDVVFYLADHLCNNVRELEGALHKLTAHARMGRRCIDLNLARAALGPMIEMPSRNLTAEVIQRVTAQHFGVKVTDLKGAKRHRTVVVPRMIAMYLVRKHTSASLPDIGRLFGGRDHTTVLHGCRKMDFDITRKPDIQAAVQAIETALGK